jgi:peptidoglycan L-alanyl-D-glutamate endopeptidase CwlK
MNRWSKRSLKNLEGVHPDLIMVSTFIMQQHHDVTCTAGVRTTEEQQDLYALGRTKPGKIVTKSDGIIKTSKHQIQEDEFGHAVDLYPFPIDLTRRYYATVRFYYLAGLINAAAAHLLAQGLITHKIRWGGDWNGNKVFDDQSFIDLPHYELIVD